MSISSDIVSVPSITPYNCYAQRKADSVARPHGIPPADIAKLLQAQHQVLTSKPPALSSQQARYASVNNPTTQQTTDSYRIEGYEASIISHLTAQPESRSHSQNDKQQTSCYKQNQNARNEVRNQTFVCNTNTTLQTLDGTITAPNDSSAYHHQQTSSTIGLPNLHRGLVTDETIPNADTQRQSENHVNEHKMPIPRTDMVEKREMLASQLSQASSIRSLDSLKSLEQETLSVSQRFVREDESSDILSLRSEPETLLCQWVPSQSSPSPTSSSPSPPLASGQQGCTKAQRMKLRQSAVCDPDSIIWTVETRKYVVNWNKEGSLGIWIQEIRGSDEIYAMVMKVDRKSPVATSGLQCGDRVLAVNGHPIHVQTMPERRLSAAEILKQQSKSEPVCLIVQSPKAIRMKKDPMSIGPRLTQKGPSSASSSLNDNRRLINDQLPLTRLPDLRLVVVGPDAENTAEQIVGPDVWSYRTDGPFFKKCVALIERTSNNVEWSALTDEGGSQISYILKKMEKEESLRNDSICDPITSSDSMVLEVVVIKNSAIAQYCSQVMMTSHCLYILQFDGQSFSDDPDRHVGELQCHLDKIQTYAGSDVPVYLLGTWPNVGDPMVPSIEKIGNQLQQRFGSEYGKQLQYHGNCPYFILNLASHSQHRASPQSLLGAYGDLEGKDGGAVSPEYQGNSPGFMFQTQSSTSTTASSTSSMWSSMTSASTAFSDFGPEACIAFLRNHIANSVFGQRFLGKSVRYPCRFLRFREIVTRLREENQKCVLTSRIKQACGLEDNEEVMRLVEYLHRQGVIFSPTMAKGSFQHSFVVLDPLDLIPVCKSLLEVPDTCQQEPRYRPQWTTLRTRGVMAPSLLRHMLGVDSECLTTCLKQLNLIHDAGSLFQSCDSSSDSHSLLKSCDPSSPDSGDASGDQAYIVPYFLPAESPVEWPWNPEDLTLYVDFMGHMSHGAFMDLMLQLSQVAVRNGGRFRTQSQKEWIFDVGSSYSLYTDGMRGKCQICFTIKCSVGFALQNVFSDLWTAVQRVMPSGRKFLLGPPCPLQERCVDEGSGPHIVDLGDGHVTCPLWCGDKEIAKYSSVKQWIRNSNQEMARNHPDTSGSVLPRDTPIRDLPPDVIQMLCNRLNVHSSTGRDWRALAAELGYTYQEEQHFLTASTLHYDPCRHLLNDWGKRGEATLGNLLSALEAPNVHRLNIICDFKSRWQITDSIDHL